MTDPAKTPQDGPNPLEAATLAADSANAAHATRTALARHAERKAFHRRNDPPAEGGLFDDIRRNTQELF